MKIIATITKYGKDDISMEYLSLPKEVEAKVYALIEPYCEGSTRGNATEVAEDVREWGRV